MTSQRKQAGGLVHSCPTKAGCTPSAKCRFPLNSTYKENRWGDEHLVFSSSPVAVAHSRGYHAPLVRGGLPQFSVHLSRQSRHEPEPEPAFSIDNPGASAPSPQRRVNASERAGRSDGKSALQTCLVLFRPRGGPSRSSPRAERAVRPLERLPATNWVLLIRGSALTRLGLPARQLPALFAVSPGQQGWGGGTAA